MADQNIHETLVEALSRANCHFRRAGQDKRRFYFVAHTDAF